MRERIGESIVETPAGRGNYIAKLDGEGGRPEEVPA